MTWKICDLKEEKMMFISDYLKGEFSFAELCERYYISRPTGYKLLNRYEAEGMQAFEEKSHARHTHPNETRKEIQQFLIDLKFRYPTWGPKKIKKWLEINHPEGPYPAASTMGDIFKKNGLVKPRRGRKKVAPYTQPFAKCEAPNQVWSVDFKGQFLLGNGNLCYPLTLTDNYSRFILLCQALKHPDHSSSFKLFKRVFAEYGLPDYIKSDNGQPFVGLGIGGLTRLSIWWLKLGIMPERIAPGHPEQNGRHERMHRTLKESTVNPPKENQDKQQRIFNKFVKEFNFERPHEALNMKRPTDVYIKSSRELLSVIPEVTYPDNFVVRKVKTNGGIKWHGKLFFVSELLHGEPIGLEPIDEERAIVYFAKLKLGTIDARKERITRPG
jgi:putative transposase